MRFACFMNCFKEVGYISLDLCTIFDEEYKAQEFCINYEEYEYQKVDEDAVCMLLLS